MNTFPDILKYLRKREHYTQEELAAALGISRSRLNNYEQGIREPDSETASLIADFFNVTFDFLFGRTEKYDITEQEYQLIQLFRKLSEQDQGMVLEMIRAMIKSKGLL